MNRLPLGLDIWSFEMMAIFLVIYYVKIRESEEDEEKRAEMGIAAEI